MTNEQRRAVVTEALKFLNAPYVHMGRNYGGVDCIGLIVEAYERAGVVTGIKLAYYPEDWAMHRDEERYLKELVKYARRVHTPPQPGDILTYQYGRCVSHAALVLGFPRVIHACRPDSSVVYGVHGEAVLELARYRGAWEVIA